MKYHNQLHKGTKESIVRSHIIRRKENETVGTVMEWKPRFRPRKRFVAKGLKSFRVNDWRELVQYTETAV